jgi:hypothetical protein
VRRRPLGCSETLCERPEERDRDFWLFCQHLAECRSTKQHRQNFVLGLHRSRTRCIVQEGHFAEEVTGGKSYGALARRLDEYRPVEDYEEGIPALPCADDGRKTREASALGYLRYCVQLTLGEAREERDIA